MLQARSTRRIRKPAADSHRERPRFQSYGHPHGYLSLLGLEPVDSGQLLKRVERGFAFRELEQLQQVLGLPMEQVGQIVQIKPRTLSRRKEQGRLLPEESDRLVRLSRLIGRTLDLFEDDADLARQWLSSPQSVLGGAIPLDLARTETGSREVDDLIGRLEHGVFS